MLCVTIYFLTSEQAAAATYRHLAPLKDFVPIVRRLYAISDRPDLNAEFHRAFSIYIGYAIIQIVCLIFLVSRLWQRIAFHRAGAKHRFGFWAGVTMSLLANFFVFFGDFNLANASGKYANKLANGDYFMSFFYCFLIPVTNIFLYVLIRSRYEKEGPDLYAPVQKAS